MRVEAWESVRGEWGSVFGRGERYGGVEKVCWGVGLSTHTLSHTTHFPTPPYTLSHISPTPFLTSPLTPPTPKHTSLHLFPHVRHISPHLLKVCRSYHMTKFLRQSFEI